MASDWSLDFCLACDKQTTEGAYCSQACRIADTRQSESQKYNHCDHSSNSPSPTTTYNGWTFPLTASPIVHSHTQHNQYAFDETSTVTSKRSSVLSFDGLFLEGHATDHRSSTSSSATSTASSPTIERQHFLADHVREALKSYENLFDQKRRRQRSVASP